MTPREGLILLVSALLTLVLLAALYVVGCYVLGRKFGTGVLLPLWLVTSSITGGLAFRRGYQPYTVGSPLHPAQLWLAAGLGLMFFLAFGLATLSVRGRLRADPDLRPSAMRVILGILAFFCGLAVVLAMFLVLDVRRLFTA